MNPYLVFILFVLVGSFIIRCLGDVLNIRNSKNHIPQEFVGVYDTDLYQKSQTYLKENTVFCLVSSGVLLAVQVIFICLGGFDSVDRLARSFSLSPIPTGMIFALSCFFLYQIVSLPFSVYRTFILEEKYGFNRTKAKTFIGDLVKGWVLVFFLGGLIWSILLWLFGALGNKAWAVCWGVVAVYELFIMTIAPGLILPLFNKFQPLEAGELKDSIEAYAKEQDFRINGIFVMDGSRRSTKTNAFFTGFGRYRRIVLFDTLIQNHSVDELVSVLAHEVGHYKRRHIQKHLALSIAIMGIMFYLMGIFMNRQGLFDAFRMTHTSIYAGIFFFAYLYVPFAFFIGILENALSRKHEYEADAFACRTRKNKESMGTALKKLAKDNLSNLTPHPLKIWLEYSHPPILARLKHIEEL
ncbi:M48 family metallopeptidase [PVC group bacterium]|nr:M48 family metallopeptidase [PVC group bacterium]